MSIYCTLLMLDRMHKDDCSYWVETEPGVFGVSGKPCNCGTPRSPLIYQGSHVLPSNSDQREGYVEIAGIPNHVTRDGRDDAPEGSLKDWLRLAVNREQVVLTRPLVTEVRDTLTEWLDREVAA